MVQINFAQKQVNAKIVYYGPGMSGKTTNLEIIHQRAPKANRGELTSISTDGDRTLFFDFMPLDLGTVAGMRTCFQIYTVPGQVYYNSTRKLVLQGVDGVIFVADSSASMLEENLESMRNLAANLAEYGRDIEHLPLVIQYNKRDLPDAMSVDELDQALNPAGVPAFEGIAHTGQGVFPTLKALAAAVIENIHSQHRAAASPSASTAAPVASASARPGAPAENSGSGNLGANTVLSQTAYHASLDSEPAQQQTAAASEAARTAGAAPAVRAGIQGGPEPQPAIPSVSAPPRGAPKLRLSNSSREPAATASTSARPALRARTAAPVAEPTQPVRRPGNAGNKTLKRPDNASSMKLTAKRAAPPPARPAAKGPPPAGSAPLRRAPRPTPVQKKGGRSALVTGIIVVASVGVGAVLGSLVLSIL